MWFINLCCCLILYGYIILCYLRKKRQHLLQAVIIGYFCCPVFKVGGVAINGTYFITFILALICLITYAEGKTKMAGLRLYYFLFIILNIYFMLNATLVNGVNDSRLIVSLLGQVNIFMGVMECALLYRTVEKPQEILKKAVITTNIIHVIFGCIQLLSVKWGYLITNQLFASPDRNGPLKVMWGTGNFYRMFGASYSPTILGGYILVAFTFLLACVLEKRKKRMGRDLCLLTVTLLIGLLAFSKTVILGVCIIFVLEAGWCVFHLNKCNKKALFQCMGVIIGAFLLVIVIAYPTRLWGQVQYYFGKILRSPTSALNTRYGNGVMSTSFKSLVASNKISDYVNTTYLTMALIKEHPLVGVGLIPIMGEFIGDSQYITILHYGGILLFLVFLFFYLEVFVTHYKSGKLSQFMVLVAIGLCGISMNSLEISVMVPFVAFCLGKWTKSGRKC